MHRHVRLCGAILLLLALTKGAPALAEGFRWGRDYLPNVTVFNQFGQPLKFYDDVIKNKIVVISFIYTSCKNICPLVTSRLVQVKDELGDVVGRDIFFVSISIDPIPDTPEKLKEQADTFHTGPGWVFLTGDPGDIDQIRYKLGERSKVITEHRNEVLLGNDRTGEWAQDSAFSDISTLAMTIRTMDPVWRSQKHGVASVQPDRVKAGSTGRQGQALFIKACASCHSIGQGDKVGPDLKGVTSRRDHDWIVRFMMGPEKMRADRDPVALALAERFPIVRMPNLQLSDGDAADLISYLDSVGQAPPGEHGTLTSPAAQPKHN